MNEPYPDLDELFASISEADLLQNVEEHWHQEVIRGPTTSPVSASICWLLLMEQSPGLDFGETMLTKGLWRTLTFDQYAFILNAGR